MSFSESGCGRGMAAGSLKDGLKEDPKQVYTSLLFYIGSHMRGVQQVIECAAHDSSDAMERFSGPDPPRKRVHRPTRVRLRHGPHRLGRCLYGASSGGSTRDSLPRSLGVSRLRCPPARRSPRRTSHRCTWPRGQRRGVCGGVFSWVSSCETRTRGGGPGSTPSIVCSPPQRRGLPPSWSRHVVGRHRHVHRHRYLDAALRERGHLRCGFRPVGRSPIHPAGTHGKARKTRPRARVVAAASR